jgi:hypothetical protein
MAITQTTVVPKTVTTIGQAVKIVRVTFDTSYPTGGEAIDVSDFSAVYGASVIGATALADNGYAVRTLCTYTTTPSATSVLLTVWQNYDPAGAGAADRVDIEYPTGTNLVANLAGPINVIIYGK